MRTRKRTLKARNVDTDAKVKTLVIYGHEKVGETPEEGGTERQGDHGDNLCQCEESGPRTRGGKLHTRISIKKKVYKGEDSGAKSQLRDGGQEGRRREEGIEN